MRTRTRHGAGLAVRELAGKPQTLWERAPGEAALLPFLAQKGCSLQAAGAADMLRQENRTNRLGGTARVDDNPARSLANADCRSWNIPNFSGCDGSVVPAVRTASSIGVQSGRGQL